MKRGFDTSRYLHAQKLAILQRIARFHKLYLEMGGKLCYDFHASRVLPGYQPLLKLNALHYLRNKELIYCINARDLQQQRIIHDYHLPLDKHALRDFAVLRRHGISVKHIVITRFSQQPAAAHFQHYLKKIGYTVYRHHEIHGYPNNIKGVLERFVFQPFIPTTQKLVIVTGAASGSGKMGVALAQLFHEYKQGNKAGFAKWETFPVWNLPLQHPLNLAYEAATADLQDRNRIDPYHKKAYHIHAVNYNRDIENFAILQQLMSSITHEHHPFRYRSPTDMCISNTQMGIIDDAACQEAARQEILRRYRQYLDDYAKGKTRKATITRMLQILKKAGLL